MKHSNLLGLVLAGGKGTRIQHLQPDCPKPMTPCENRPFLEWVLLHLRRQLGVKDFVISIGYMADLIEKYLETRPIAGIETHSYCESAPLGTGGAIRDAWSGHCGRDIVACNGDSLLLADYTQACEAFLLPEVDGVIIGIPRDDVSRYGSLDIDSHGRLISFHEKQPGAGVINGGIYLLKSHLLTNFPAQTPLSIEHDVFPSWLKQNIDIRVVVCDGPFLDIGTPETFAQTSQFIRANWPDDGFSSCG